VGAVLELPLEERAVFEENIVIIFDNVSTPVAWFVSFEIHVKRDALYVRCELSSFDRLEDNELYIVLKAVFVRTNLWGAG
jgi:hypothetical protein